MGFIAEGFSAFLAPAGYELRVRGACLRVLDGQQLRRRQRLRRQRRRQRQRQQGNAQPAFYRLLLRLRCCAVCLAVGLPDSDIPECLLDGSSAVQELRLGELRHCH